MLLLIFIYKYDYKGKLKGDSFALGVIFVLFVLIPSLSRDMGSDTMRYQEWFTYLPSLSSFSINDFTWEPLFCLYMSFLKTLSTNWVVAHTMLILFINIPIFIFCKKYVNSKYTFLLIYFLLHFYEINFEPLRQSCALAMIIWALPYMQRKKYIKFYLLIALAIGFHYTAIVCALLPIVSRFKLCSWKIVTICIGVFALSAIIRLYLGNLVDLLSLHLGYTKYDAHMELEGLNANGLIMIVFIKILPVFAAMYVCQKRDIIKETNIINGLSILFVIFMIGRTFIPIFERFTLMFFLAQAACYADAIICRKSKSIFLCLNNNKPLILKLIPIYLCLAFLYNVNSYYRAGNQYGEPNIMRCVPYKSIFN